VTFFEHVVAARATLEAAGISTTTARLDADLLARHALGWDQARWLAHRDETADAAFVERYRALIARRVRREPAAQIRGVQEFWGREFLVTRDVLTPRAETEILIEVAGEYLRTHPAAHVADVGTGSGCIAITLALDYPAARIEATDISGEALAVARENARRLGAESRVQFHLGSFLAAAPRPIDLIVSNPPYVATTVAAAIAPEVRDYEPSVALFGGADGLDAVRALLQEAGEALSPHGLLLFEVGYDQADAVAAAISADRALTLVEVRDDLQRIPRVIIARRSRAASGAIE
jgi:release factor glutamine methyltransferase